MAIVGDSKIVNGQHPVKLILFSDRHRYCGDVQRNERYVALIRTNLGQQSPANSGQHIVKQPTRPFLCFHVKIPQLLMIGFDKGSHVES